MKSKHIKTKLQIITYLANFSNDIGVNDGCIDVTCSRKQILWKINFEPLTQPVHPHPSAASQLYQTQHCKCNVM